MPSDCRRRVTASEPEHPDRVGSIYRDVDGIERGSNNPTMNSVVSAISQIGWPGLPAAPGAAALALQYQLEQTQRFPLERLRVEQLRQLKLVLRHAAVHVPYYRERFLALGFDANADPSWDDFQRLPTLRRFDLQEYRNELVSQRPMGHHGRLLEGHSSGSTGQPVRFLKTATVNLFEQALALRDHLWHGRDLLAKHAAIRASVDEQEVRGWGPAVQHAFWSGPSASLDIRSSIDEQARWLRRTRPRYLLTHPSNARALALHCIEHKIELPGLAELRTFGEVVHPELPALVREAWNAMLADIYSSEEVGSIALQCPEQGNYHVQSENLVLEVVDDAGLPQPIGVAGRVLLTTLHNFAMPLIRYELGDYAAMGEQCACGRGLPVLARIMGRRRNLVTLPDGTRHWPFFSIKTWAYDTPVRQMQLVQNALTHIEVRLVSAHALDRVQSDRLVESLRGALGYPFEISIVYVSEIKRGGNQKYEDFVSLVGEER